VDKTGNDQRAAIESDRAIVCNGSILAIHSIFDSDFPILFYTTRGSFFRTVSNPMLRKTGIISL
jgi:hypothetical protein